MAAKIPATRSSQNRDHQIQDHRLSSLDLPRGRVDPLAVTEGHRPGRPGGARCRSGRSSVAHLWHAAAGVGVRPHRRLICQPQTILVLPHSDESVEAELQCLPLARRNSVGVEVMTRIPVSWCGNRLERRRLRHCGHRVCSVAAPWDIGRRQSVSATDEHKTAGHRANRVEWPICPRPPFQDHPDLRRHQPGPTHRHGQATPEGPRLRPSRSCADGSMWVGDGPSQPVHEPCRAGAYLTARRDSATDATRRPKSRSATS